MTINLPLKVKEVLQKFQQSGYECYAVGGSVRDTILGRETHDWDFTTNATPPEVQKIWPDSFYENDFGTVGLKMRGKDGETEEVFEITTYRKEGKYTDARHPEVIKWAKTIEEDLSRRDFTMNAIAAGTERIIDPYSGTEDINNQTIRAVGVPDDRFQEDALRLMRAIRLATQLGFSIEEKTWEAIKNNSGSITQISGERIRDELIKILSSEFPADGIKLLYNAGLLEHIFPELTKGAGMKQPGHHISDVFTHSVDALRYVKNREWLVRLAALIHDIGKPATYLERNGKPTFYNHEVVGANIAKSIANRLHFTKEQREKLYILVRWHMFSVSELLTDSAIRRFIHRIGPENTADMLDVRIADRLGSGAKESSWRLEQFKQRIIDVQKHIPSVKDLKVNGKDVMEVLGIGPGPKIGEILNKLFEEITEDPEKNEREYLLNRIKEISN